MKFLVSSVFLLVSIPLAWAQQIARTKAIDDLTFLNETVVNGHPVNYNPARPVVTLLPVIKALSASRQDSLTPTEFRQLLNDAIFTIGCVHTRIRNSPLSVAKTAESFFPGSVVIRHGKLVDSLNREIIAINGIAAQQLVTQINHAYASDGATTALATAVFARNGSSLLAHYLNYPAHYTLRLDTTSLLFNATKTRPAQSVAPIRYESTLLDSSGANLFYAAANVPVLKLTTFNKRDMAFFNRTFRYLKTAAFRHLVLDLRGNLGGHRNSAVVLTQHLLGKTFSYSIVQPKLAIRHYLNSRGRFNLFLSRLKYNVGSCLRGRQTALGRSFVYRYKPKKDRFDGQVYVLTDGYTASASTMVTSWLKQHSKALFIGQQSGGGYNGNNGGSFAEITLPNTRYTIVFPVYRLVLDAQSTQTQGILPDIPIEPALHEDNTLSQTITLIESSQR